MQNLLASIILAIVQGLTEWLPVSSTGHLVLFEYILGFNGGLTFDVALHFGTLMAAFVYFGRDIVDILEAFLKGQWKSEKAKLGYLLIVATIPGALIGYTFHSFFEATFESLWGLAIQFGITALTLFIASMDLHVRKRNKVRYRDAAIIGIAQAPAILPAISRSGTTIAAGVLLGLEEKLAIRFSFLMSIPIIFGASLFELGTGTLPTSYFLPTIVSFLVGIVTIHVLLNYVLTSKRNLKWFGWYCLILAVAIAGYLVFA